MINNATHKLLEIVGSKTSRTFRISFKDSDVFLLRNLNPIDSSIYDLSGLWSAEIVEAIRMPPKRKKLFKQGVGLDFKEEDIQEIIDVSAGELLNFASIRPHKIADNPQIRDVNHRKGEKQTGKD